MTTYTLTDLLYLMERLRDPATGCPWDIAQDFRSITPSTIEEAYEVVDAIEQGDFTQLRDELGDLLFQVIFYAQLGREQGCFDFAQVVDGLTAKLIRRHPHVFKDGQLNALAVSSEVESQDVKVRWELIKQQERENKGLRGVLADVPNALPAMSRAQKLQKRAAGVGFDFADTASVMARLQEELVELQESLNEADADAIEDELGDVFFSVVNLSRHLHLDGEKSLRRANLKFTQRFNWVEHYLQQQGLSWSTQTPAELDELWRLAKMSSTQNA